MTRRAKDVAESARSAVAVTASSVWRPFVHPWMLEDAEPLRHAMRQLDDHLPRVEAVLARTGMNEAAAGDLVTAIRDVRNALDALASALDVHGTRLRDVLRHHPTSLREIRSCTNVLADADGDCRRAVEAAGRALPTLGNLLARTPWATAGERPRGRADLEALPATEARAALARDPRLLAAVTDPHDATGPAWLAPALGDADDDPAVVVAAGSLLRVDRVRRACTNAGADAVRRAALTHPRALGGLDGVPVWARCEANRLVMRSELRRMRARDRELAREIAVEHDRDARSPWRAVTGRVLDAWLANDAATAIATVDVDRATARRADLRALVELTRRLLHDRVSQGRGRWGHRQVVAFHPDGRVVELWGTLDAETEQVAVYVGGTGTTVRQFGWPTNIVRALFRADPTGRTAVVTWMGARFPSAIGTQSPFGRFARAAAAPLRDCVEGLDVPDGVPITVVGHSYGGTIVGAAEALGLRVDRVVHAGVPGIGPGVRSVADYPDHDALGRARRVTRYALTAPGDLIRLWRRGDAALSSLSSVPFAPARTVAERAGEKILGADPMTLPGIVELDTGVWETDRDDRRRGEVLVGPRGHADCVEPGTTSFRRIVAVVQGEDPREITPPPDLVPFRR
ncbi:alpha/beta hydrolase [Mobilicoccus pelagius]|uniref:DUF1023 domain-containing protein n=1 Tax=Mobilicoccus pelagius NBRC 104925 TaxID=1089455 RepID=H5UNJ4_9MICO|nr:alpha/beta hydrolase [Mobilicoccus pelagius]GAB47302.1 hypothetical protein MOPEL_007_01180 [Mobilicoccus pelagius NBRC 104925]